MVLHGAGRSMVDDGVEWVLNGTRVGTEGWDEERDGGLAPAGCGVANGELISAGRLVGADAAPSILVISELPAIRARILFFL
jgi:hypothetical protein